MFRHLLYELINYYYYYYYHTVSTTLIIEWLFVEDLEGSVRDLMFRHFLYELINYYLLLFTIYTQDNTKYRVNTHRHSCLDWDSIPRPLCVESAETVHALHRAVNGVSPAIIWFRKVGVSAQNRYKHFLKTILERYRCASLFGIN
jgi:hypothetical protein